MGKGSGPCHGRGEGKAALGRVPRARQGHHLGGTHPEAWRQGPRRPMRLATAVQHAASMFAAAAPPRRQRRGVQLRRIRRQAVHRASAIGPVAMQRLQQLQHLQQHRCSSTSTTSARATTAAATHASRWRTMAFMPRTPMPLPAASSASSAGASSDVHAQHSFANIIHGGGRPSGRSLSAIPARAPERACRTHEWPPGAVYTCMTSRCTLGLSRSAVFSVVCNRTSSTCTRVCKSKCKTGANKSGSK